MSGASANGAGHRSLADQLRGWPEERLTRLLRARPDLATPAPQDSSQLASRAATRASLARALDRLSHLELAVLDAVVVVGPATDDERGRRGGRGRRQPRPTALERLADLALVWQSTGGLRALTGVAAALAPGSPGASGVRPRSEPPLAADRVADQVAGLSEPARRMLDHVDAHGGQATTGAARRHVAPEEASSPAEELLARRLLVPRDDGLVVLPGEVALALRGGRTTREPVDDVPALATSARSGSLVDRAAAGAASEAVHRVELLLDHWGLEPPAELRSGGLVGPRPQGRRRAAAHHRAGRGAAGRGGGRGRAARRPGRRRRRPGAGADRRVRRLAGRRPRAALAGAGRGLAAHASATPRSSAPATSPARAATPCRPTSPARPWPSRAGWRWRRWPTSPRARCWPAAPASRPWWPGSRGSGPGGPPRAPPRWRPRSRSRPCWASPGSAAWPATAGRCSPATSDAAVAALAALLPSPVSQVVLQADLTAVAPGPLESTVGRRLHLLADVESRGGATVYRFTAGSLRRALDQGWSAHEVHAFLDEVAATEVPQPLRYLVDDTARTFGSVRAGHAESYLRADDETVLAGLLHHPKAAALRLRRLAPTVVTSELPLEVLLPRLRELGRRAGRRGRRRHRPRRPARPAARPDAARSPARRRRRGARGGPGRAGGSGDPGGRPGGGVAARRARSRR